MFEVRKIISVFSKMRLERKQFGNHWFKHSSHSAQRFPVAVQGNSGTCLQ